MKIKIVKSDKYYTEQIDDFKICRDGVSGTPRYEFQYKDHSKNIVIENKRQNIEFIIPEITTYDFKSKKKHIKFEGWK